MTDNPGKSSLVDAITGNFLYYGDVTNLKYKNLVAAGAIVVNSKPDEGHSHKVKWDGSAWVAKG